MRWKHAVSLAAAAGLAVTTLTAAGAASMEAENTALAVSAEATAATHTAKIRAKSAHELQPAAVEEDRTEEDQADLDADEADEKTPEEIELERMRAETERLSAEFELMSQRQRNQLMEAELERQRLESEASLRQARQAAELAQLNQVAEELGAETQRLQAEQSLKEAERARELAEMRADVERMQAERELAEAQREQEMDAWRIKSEKIFAENQVVMAELSALQTKTEMHSLKTQSEMMSLNNTLSLSETKEKVKDVVTNDVEYRADPYVDGTLYVSDRRIPLNGPIFWGTADYVTDRIHFFNNQDAEAPIFIVIDDSPGGSVMEGYRILKAMESSRAPVYVLVKSFAASMAATICTLAERSFAYPNAIILHHQMSSGMFGNLTQQAEQLENGREWSRRLAKPIADKMGITEEKFVELMYENNSDGDWDVFADEALKLNWVYEVIVEAREEGIRARPKTERWSFPFFFEAMKTDEKGQKYIELPPLRPFDHYFMYNPTNFYRW